LSCREIAISLAEITRKSFLGTNRKRPDEIARSNP
jgi:hypothetical protein